MCRKEKVLMPMQHMEMSGEWKDDDLYWTSTRCK